MIEKTQLHVHKVFGNLNMDNNQFTHQHVLIGITGKQIILENHQHIHTIYLNSDSSKGHYHNYVGKTSVNISVGKGHIHSIEGIVSNQKNHQHHFKVITDIEDE